MNTCKRFSSRGWHRVKPSIIQAITLSSKLWYSLLPAEDLTSKAGNFLAHWPSDWHTPLGTNTLSLLLPADNGETVSSC